MKPTERDPENDGPVTDLSPLRSLGLDRVRHEALASRIEAAAAPALLIRARRRPLALELQTTLARAAWPALIAAAAAVLVAVGLDRETTTVSPIELVAAWDTAEGSPTWVAEQRAPTDDDLAAAIGLGAAQ